MNDVPHPFAPFQPSPSIVPSKSGGSPEVTIEQSGKRPRKAKVAKEAADLKVGTVVNITAEKPARKPRAAKQKTLKAHSPKFDLQTTLAAAQLLNEGDFPLFEKMVVALDEVGKPARDRVLGALSKVFG